MRKLYEKLRDRFPENIYHVSCVGYPKLKPLQLYGNDMNFVCLFKIDDEHYCSWKLTNWIK